MRTIFAFVCLYFLSLNMALVGQTHLAQFQQLDGVSYADVAWGDYDGDGDLDLVYIGQNTLQQKTVRLYRYQNGVFAEVQTAFEPVINGALAWGDYDNDNDLDLALSGASANDGYITRIYRYDAGSGNFTWDQTIALEGAFYSCLCWGDIDNDGDLDLFVSGRGNSGLFTKVYQNDGQGGLSPDDMASAEFSHSAATGALLDYDNDGDLDYLTAAKIYKNNGHGTFSFDQVASDSLTQYGVSEADAAAWMDLDADGDLDVVLTGLSALIDDGRVYLNDGAGGFFYDADFSQFLENVREEVPGDLGDYNNDGTADFISAGLSARLPLYDMANVFSNVNNIMAFVGEDLTGTFRGSARWGDFDNDGDLDAVVVGDSGHVEGESRYEDNRYAAIVYRNTIGVANTAPSVPGNQRVEFPAYDRAKLIWDATTDSETPAASLTYNLRVGTTPGATDIMSPQANLQNGELYFPHLGNANYNTFRYLTGLEPGMTYYWSVQAIDNGYQASAFSAEGQFTLPDSAFMLTDALLTKVKNSISRWLDYDGDGDLDVLLYGLDENDNPLLQLFQNDGDFNFHFDAVASNILPPLKNGAVAVGDWDNDNWPDIYVTGLYYGSREAYVYRNTGADGVVGFEKGFGDWVLNMGFENACAAWYDADRDGDQDLLVSGDSDLGLVAVLYENKGDRLWPDYYDNRDNGLIAVRNGSIDWGDFNNDGWPDLLLSGAGEGNTPKVLALFENQHDLTFSQLTPGFPGLTAGMAKLVDFDYDGDLDMVAGGNFSGNDLRFFENGGNGNFDQVLIYNNFEYAQNCAFDFGDFDNDGDLDFLYSGDDDGIFFARISVNENGQFNNHPIFSKKLTGVRNGDITFGDADNDGKPDILLSGEMQNGFPASLIYQNRVGSANTHPEAPSGLSVVVQYNTAQLQWNAAADESGAANLFYNVRVGSTPGSTDIVSPLADIANGFQRLPARTNAGLNLSLSLENLDYELTYYWSVQAIDRGRAASDWAEEQSFSVGLPPFSEHPLELENLKYGSMEWGDYSGDGRLDLLETGISLEQRGSIFYRQAFGFIKDEVPTSLTEGVGRGTGIFGDYDHDGDLDVFIAGDGATASVTRLYEYTNRGWFAFDLDTAASAVFDSVMDVDATWADFDNDGDLDLAIMGVSLQTASEVRLYYNTRESFVLGDSLEIIHSGAMAAADIDHDGFVELFVSGKNNDGPLLRLYKRTPSGYENQSAAVAAVTPLFECDVAFADFDNDGWLDLLVSGNAGTILAREPRTRLYRNAEGIFEPAAEFPGLYSSNISWGDYNNDGWIDFILCGQQDVNTSNSQIYQNVDGVSFRFDEKATASLTDLQFGAQAQAWGDFDNDGDLDLAAQGTFSHLYTNNSSVQNLAPQAPENLRVTFRDTLTILSWSPARDDHTPAPALTYNVRVGTSSNALDIVSPAAQDDGWRKLAKMGNAGPDTFFVLQNLPPVDGIYWSVQAIDQAFKGSEFAAEMYFAPAVDMSAQIDTLQWNGPASGRINMVFLAEGYRAQEMGRFQGDARAMINGIFAFEPFAAYRSYFNVFSIFVSSHESGASRKRDGDFRDTFFNATFETFPGATQFLSIPPADTLIAGIEPDYAAGLGKVDSLINLLLPDADMVTILINDNQYGGSAIRWRDRALALVSMSATAAHDIVHEIGHTIGLGDEYEYPLPLPQLEFPNTTQANKRQDIVWRHWIADDTPLPTPDEPLYENTVGLFEGANYSANGWYRPQQSCKMRTNQNNTAFCLVCREWLIKSIYGYRWQAQGFPQPANRIRPLRLIQNQLPRGNSLTFTAVELVQLQVETLIPASHEITYHWFIDGQKVDTLRSQAAEIPAVAIGAGNHRITAVAWDSSAWVRHDPKAFLTDSTTWFVEIEGGNAVRDGEDLPQVFALQQNYPNPFNPETTIQFALLQTAEVTLAIYSTTGQHIRTLVRESLQAGSHRIIWNGRDDRGENVSSGIYIYKMTAGSFTASRKLILVR